jgi:phospholipid/cholesterol/gamma-HCH transport system substrate-binding protein
MENRAHALAAGLFALFLGAGVVVAAMWLTGDIRERQPYVLETRHRVTGLTPQAAVRYRGVDVGRVTGIRFDPRDVNVILIDVVVDADAPMTRSTYAQLRYQGVTGLSFIMLDDAGDHAEPLPPAGMPGSASIPVKESPFADIAEVGQEVLAEVSELVQRLNRLLDDPNQERVARTLDNVEAATRELAVLTRSLEPAARGVAPLVADTRAALSDVRAAVKQADALLAEFSGVGREVAKRMETLSELGRHAERAGVAVEAMTERIAADSLPRINMLVEELAQTARHIDQLVLSLRDQPQSLVFGRRAAPPGPGEPGFEERSRAGR